MFLKVECKDMILLMIVMATVVLGGTFLAAVAFCFSEPSLALRLAFMGLVVVGVGVALWCAFFVWYQPRPNLRIRGVPVPSQVLQLESGNWVPFEGPGWLLNLVFVTSLVTMPLSLPLIVRGFRRLKVEGLRGFSVAPEDWSVPVDSDTGK